MQDLAAFERKRYTFPGHRDDPHRGILAVGATYAMLDRRDAAKAVGPSAWFRLLPKQDALVWELYRQNRMRGAMKSLEDRTDRAESYALFWMFVLLGYVFVVALFA
jgi:hypothetical protein